MYNEVTNFMNGVGETSPIMRGLGKLLFNSEERYNTPFRYYERKRCCNRFASLNWWSGLSIYDRYVERKFDLEINVDM